MTISKVDADALRSAMDGYVTAFRKTVETAFTKLSTSIHTSLATMAPTGFVIQNAQFRNQCKSSADKVTGAIHNKVIEVGNVPTSLWIGDWAGMEDSLNAAKTVCKNANARMRITPYNIPDRDLGSYSNGGASGPDAYLNWWRSIIKLIGTEPVDVFLEPDAIGHALRLPGAQSDERLATLGRAIELMPLDRWRVYIDAGHASWPDIDPLVVALLKVGVVKTKRIALNISNMHSRESCQQRFKDLKVKIPELVGYAVDTSRAGVRVNDEWCNPFWAKFGPLAPKDNNSSYPGQEVEMWIKPPGQSDGTCNGGPNAGEWYHDLFIQMIKNTFSL